MLLENQLFCEKEKEKKKEEKERKQSKRKKMFTGTPQISKQWKMIYRKLGMQPV